MTWHVDIRSFLRGIAAMRFPHEKVNYALQLTHGWDRGWWLCLWTPRWHEGRGPYISVGVGFFRFVRGY